MSASCRHTHPYQAQPDSIRAPQRAVQLQASSLSTSTEELDAKQVHTLMLH